MCSPARSTPARVALLVDGVVIPVVCDSEGNMDGMRETTVNPDA
jgi:hypothetical protein